MLPVFNPTLPACSTAADLTGPYLDETLQHQRGHCSLTPSLAACTHTPVVLIADERGGVLQGQKQQENTTRSFALACQHRQQQGVVLVSTVQDTANHNSITESGPDALQLDRLSVSNNMHVPHT
jgi:hypothetical protein